MNDHTQNTDTRQARWARFRFSIIGPFLSAPPERGELKPALAELAKKQWRHPTTGSPVSFSLSTLERWFYRAKRNADPVGALRTNCSEDKIKPHEVVSRWREIKIFC